MTETVLVLIEVPAEHLKDVLNPLADVFKDIPNMPNEIHFAQGGLARDIMALFWADYDNKETK